MSHAAQEGRDFLASDDAWFRPVNLEIGPDGALYVVDMHRAVIEHPQYMPSELQQRPDLRLGDDRGRIYRIVKAGDKRPAVRPNLRSDSTAHLVELLEHPNAWWRETAGTAAAGARGSGRQSGTASAGYQRGHRAGPRASPVAARKPQAPRSLDDRAAPWPTTIRECAPRAWLWQSRGWPPMTDCEARSSRQPATTILGCASRSHWCWVDCKGEDVSAALARIALAAHADIWTRAAVSTELPEHLGQTVAAVLQSPALATQPQDASVLGLVKDLATTLGASREPGQIGPVLKQISNQTDLASEAALTGLAVGLERRGATLAEIVAQLPDADALAAALRKRLEQIGHSVQDDSLSEPLAPPKSGC